jgi:hypothetical protein
VTEKISNCAASGLKLMFILHFPSAFGVNET